jgi:hypothetical protein
MSALRHAALQESRALRLLPAGTRCRPLDIAAAIDDYEWFESNRRVREARRARGGRRGAA